MWYNRFAYQANAAFVLLDTETTTTAQSNNLCANSARFVKAACLVGSGIAKRALFVYGGIVPKSMNADQKRRARLRLAKLYGWKCHYCGQKLIPDDRFFELTTSSYCNGEILRIPIPGYEIPTLDHVQPLSRGGQNDISNLVLCCPVCNHKKGNR